MPLPPPSELAFTDEHFPDAPPAFAIRAALSLRKLLRRIADRLVPPELVLFEHSTGIASTMLLGAVARAGVADLLEREGPMDAARIASALSLDEDATHRTLRALSTMGLFAMSDDGVFSNNAISSALVSGRLSRTREWILYFASASNAGAWLDVEYTLRTGKNAFAHAHGESVWSWFDGHEDERAIFAHAMMGLTVQDAPFLAKTIPFGEVKKVCDVGGGRGTLLSEILVRHPHLSGVLCENAGVAESAKKLFASRGVGDRVEIVAGSFFERVPRGCDAYVLKNILHDWDDVRSKTILGIVRAAMDPGARLFVCEMLVDHTSRSTLGTQSDLQMMTVCDEGRERSVEQFRTLVEATGFRFVRAFPSPLTGVIEAVAR